MSAAKIFNGVPLGVDYFMFAARLMLSIINALIVQ